MYTTNCLNKPERDCDVRASKGRLETAAVSAHSCKTAKAARMVCVDRVLLTKCSKKKRDVQTPPIAALCNARFLQRKVKFLL